MLTTSVINGMLNVLDDYLTNLTVVYDITNSINIDDNISIHSSKNVGYTNDGAAFIEPKWNTASGGVKSLDTSADDTPIMFAIKSVTTPTHLIFYNGTTGVIYAIDKLDTPITYTNDGPFYMYAYSIEMEESV